MRSWFGRSALHGFCLSLVASAVVIAQERRPLTPDDLFSLKDIGRVVLSPEGRDLAYEMSRPRLSARAYNRLAAAGRAYYTKVDRMDVWLAPLAGGAPINLTNGETDGSSSFMPTWSPDGA